MRFDFYFDQMASVDNDSLISSKIDTNKRVRLLERTNQRVRVQTPMPITQIRTILRPTLKKNTRVCFFRYLVRHSILRGPRTVVVFNCGFIDRVLFSCPKEQTWPTDQHFQLPIIIVMKWSVKIGFFPFLFE